MQKSIFRTLAVAALALAASVASAGASAVQAVKQGAVAVGEHAYLAATSFMQGAGLIIGLVTFADTYTGKYPVLMTPPRSDVLEVVIPFTMPAANVSVNDILALCKVPANVKIVDWFIWTDDADSNGTPTIAYSLGSLNSASAPTALTTTYKAAISTLQTGTTQRCDTTTAQLESAAAERPIGLLFSAVAATYVASKTGMLVLKLSDN